MPCPRCILSDSGVRYSIGRPPRRLTLQHVELTIGGNGSGERVELAVGVDQRNGCLHAVKGVVPRVARHEVFSTRPEAICVEQTRDAGACHASPVVVVAAEHTGQDGYLRVSCENEPWLGV